MAYKNISALYPFICISRYSIHSDTRLTYAITYVLAKRECSEDEWILILTKCRKWQCSRLNWFATTNSPVWLLFWETEGDRYFIISNGDKISILSFVFHVKRDVFPRNTYALCIKGMACNIDQHSVPTIEVSRLSMLMPHLTIRAFFIEQ